MKGQGTMVGDIAKSNHLNGGLLSGARSSRESRRGELAPHHTSGIAEFLKWCYANRGLSVVTPTHTITSNRDYTIRI
jgi:hypothetical protein